MLKEMFRAEFYDHLGRLIHWYGWRETYHAATLDIENEAEKIKKFGIPVFAYAKVTKGFIRGGE